MSQLLELPVSWKRNLRNDSDAVQYVNDILSDSRDAYASWMRDASINLAWASGEQHLSWNPECGLDMDPRFQADPLLERRSTNFCRLYVISQIVRVIRARWDWKAIPRSASEADANTAIVASRWLPAMWDLLAADDPMAWLGTLWHVFTTGTAFAYPHWDDEGEDTVIPSSAIGAMISKTVRDHPEAAADGDQEALLNAFLEEASGNEYNAESLRRNKNGDIVYREGRMRLSWLTGFDVIEDPRARVSSDWRWVVVQQMVPIESVYDRYADKAEGIQGSRITSFRNAYNPLYAEKLESGDHAAFPVAMVHTLWIPRSREMPEGWKCVTCEDQLLEKGPNPYRGARIPLIPFRESPDQHDLRPSPRFNDIRRLQRSHNFSGEQIAEHRRKTVRQRVVAHDNSLVGDWLNPVKGVVYWKGAVPPSLEVPPPIPAYVFQDHITLAEHIRYLGGMDEIALGQADSRATSGVAIRAHQERSDMQSSLVVQSLEWSLAELGWHLLELQGQFEPDERTITIVGEDLRSEVYTLAGKDVLSAGENNGRSARRFDVKVAIGDARSQVVATDTAMMLLERGVLHPERDRTVILRAISEGLLPTDQMLSRRHAVNAWKENELLSALNREVQAGRLDPKQFMLNDLDEAQQPVPSLVVFEVHPGDDHEEHLSAHFELTIDRDKWDTIHPILQAYMAWHLAQHQQLAIASMGAMDNGRRNGNAEPGRDRGPGTGNGSAAG